MSQPKSCPFCDKNTLKNALWTNGKFFVVPDVNPIEPGHLLVVSHSHVTKNIFELYDDVRKFQEALIFSRKYISEHNHNVTGLNVLANIGKGGGQTIDHCHVHIVPRYA